MLVHIRHAGTIGKWKIKAGLVELRFKSGSPAECGSGQWCQVNTSSAAPEVDELTPVHVARIIITILGEILGQHGKEAVQHLRAPIIIINGIEPITEPMRVGYRKRSSRALHLVIPTGCF